MRYFLHLAYNGHNFHGWQKQPHSHTVQQSLEDVLALLLREPIATMGCGRTDTGVHASKFIAHFDTKLKLPDHFVSRLNRLLPPGIVIYSCKQVEKKATDEMLPHARFSAMHRAYRYDIVSKKDPFRTHTAWHYPQFDKLDIAAMQKAANLLLSYKEFAPFCKTKSDAKTMKCDLRKAEWQLLEQSSGSHNLAFHIASNRFLRGMVRLIVGASITIGRGQMTLAQLQKSLDEQKPLSKPLSVPPTGLFLTEVEYDFDL